MAISHLPPKKRRDVPVPHAASLPPKKRGRDASQLQLLDLPEELLQMILHCASGSDRCRVGAVCKALRDSYHACAWRKLCVSMHRATRRGRCGSVPHWSSDVDTVFSIVRQPQFRQLHRLAVRIDAPCFEPGLGNVRNGVASHLFRPCAAHATLHHSTVRHLDVRVLRHNYHNPTAAALVRMLRFFPCLVHVTLSGVNNLGRQLMGMLLLSGGELRALRSLRLQHCNFTGSGASVLVAQLGHGTSWNPGLETLSVLGPMVAMRVVRVAALYVGLQGHLHLPSSLRHLHIDGLFNSQTPFQALRMLRTAPALRTVVMPARLHRWHALGDVLSEYEQWAGRRLGVIHDDG